MEETYRFMILKNRPDSHRFEVMRSEGVLERLLKILKGLRGA
jgi:hypothetical protein